MALTSTVAALELLAKASKALDSIREQSKTSKDSALKENISKLYDDFLDLKAVILRLTEEISKLIAEQAKQPRIPEIRQEGLTNYYYIGAEGPFCQPCYDGNRKLVNLTPQQTFVGGTGRRCEVCNKVFFEIRKSHNRSLGPSRFGPCS
jgi:hypothetical protein